MPLGKQLPRSRRELLEQHRLVEALLYEEQSYNNDCDREYSEEELELEEWADILDQQINNNKD